MWSTNFYQTYYTTNFLRQVIINQRVKSALRVKTIEIHNFRDVFGKLQNVENHTLKFFKVVPYLFLRKNNQCTWTPENSHFIALSHFISPRGLFSNTIAGKHVGPSLSNFPMYSPVQGGKTRAHSINHASPVLHCGSPEVYPGMIASLTLFLQDMEWNQPLASVVADSSTGLLLFQLLSSLWESASVRCDHLVWNRTSLRMI